MKESALQAIKIRLRFTAPIHLASHGVGYESTDWLLHSDTLYSAIISVWSKVFPSDMAKIVPEKEEMPPFRLSSAFPYYEDMEFYPKPLISYQGKSGHHVSSPCDPKQFGKVRFIEGQLFHNLLCGELLEFDPNFTLQDGLFWAGKNKGTGQLIYEIERPHVVIDRVTNTSQNYFIGEVHFREQAGLFFWVRFMSNDIKKRFIQVLRFLGDEGLGLDRSSGRGFFEVDDANIIQTELPGLSDSSRFMTLSLYHPNRYEMTETFLANSGYDLMQRGGYIMGKSYRRKTITMFAEGSVFCGQTNEEYGRRVTAIDHSFAVSAIEHPVYRYGYAFPVGIYEETRNE